MQGLTTGYKFSSAGAVAMLVFFFMPWGLVSCGAQPLATLSGSQLLVGVQVGGESVEGNPLFAIVPLVSLATLVLAGLAAQRGVLTSLDRFGVTVLGIIALILMAYTAYSFSNVERESSGVMSVRVEYGFWGALVGALMVLAGGVNNAQEKPPE